MKLCNYDPSEQGRTYELDITKHISSANHRHSARGRGALATATKAYMIQSPHGREFLALGFEPMREPLWIFRRRITHKDRVTLEALPLIKVYLQILLEGLDYMHSQAHVIHTGG